jgi:hypothetical protein
MESMTQVKATVAHREYQLDADEIRRLLRDVLPDPLHKLYVAVDGRRYPPKQVLAVATGLDPADFNTHHARNILARLGFTVGRLGPITVDSSGARRPGPHGGAEADLLRPFVGQWVAQRGLEVLVAASDPTAVYSWLQRHNRTADAVFRVPEHPSESETPALS